MDAFMKIHSINNLHVTKSKCTQKVSIIIINIIIIKTTYKQIKCQ
jgi:hypothetical protein